MRIPRSVPRAGGVQVGAIPWFDEETYPRMLRIVDDPHEHPGSYEAWRETALERERDYKGRKVMTVRIKINIEEFVGWCRNLAVDPGSVTLERFAHFRAVGRIYE